MIRDRFGFRRLALAVACIATLLSPPYVVQLHASITDNLAEYWKLDEASGTRAGSVGSNNLTDSGVGSATGLVYSLAADFETSENDFLSIADNATVSFGDIDATIIIFTKLESLIDASAFVSKDNASIWDYDVFINASAVVSFYVENASSGSASVAATSFGGLSNGVWYMILVQHDATNNLIGISINNGTLDTASHTGGMRDSGNSLYFGKESSNVSADALIGPVIFWKRLLTTDEKACIYNSGAGRTYETLVSACDGAGGSSGRRLFPLLGVGR